MTLFFPFQHPHIQILHLLSGPRRLAQKGQTGFDAGIAHKAIDGNPPAQFLPAKMGYQFVQYDFQRFAVQRIIRHGIKIMANL